MLNTIDEGIKAVRQGKIVIVVDDENREMKVILSYPAKKITPDIVNFHDYTWKRASLCTITSFPL